MNKRFGGMWRLLAVAMLLCAFMTVVLSAGVEAAPPENTTLSVNPVTGTYNGTVTLYAKLTWSGGNVRDANISFTLNGISAGNATTNSTGVATRTGVNISRIAAGTYAAGVGAIFSGSSGYNASSGTATLTVNKAAQTISFTTHPPTRAVYGTNFTVVAKSTSGLAVNYSSSGAASNSGGTYTMTSGTGTATVIVNQAGNANYSAATQLTDNVTAVKASSSAALASSSNPSSYNQSVIFTATVSGHPGTPTGNVTFMDGSRIMAANVTMSGGGTTLTTSSLTVASHAITAVYNGDSNFNRSTSSTLNQMVNKAGTTTSLSTSCNSSIRGHMVMFTANVTGAGASGTVIFMDGNITMGNSTLNAGTTVFNTSTLLIGNHSITAVYSGDGNFSGSTSAAITQTVKAGINWGLVGGLVTAGVVVIALVVTLVLVRHKRKA